jgi:nitroreductase
MDFFETAQRRRSTRKYTAKPVPAEVMKKAFAAAQIAPNSSNLQTSQFYWVKSPESVKQLKEACLNQGAAVTAQELVVVVSQVGLWRTAATTILANSRKDGGTVAAIESYYGKLIPFLYTTFPGLSLVKSLLFFASGLFKPTPRRPTSRRDLDEVSIKSAALACQNFMLAISAQGYDTCPMEGFDERRVQKLLGVGRSSRIVMVLSAGERDPKGIWGPQFRLPLEHFLKEV